MRRRRRIPLTVCAGVCAALLGCPTPLPDAGGLVFGCRAADDCRQGERCVGGTCVRASADAGHPDVLVADIRISDALGADVKGPDGASDGTAADRVEIDGAVNDLGASDLGEVDSTADDSATATDVLHPDSSGRDHPTSDAIQPDTVRPDTALTDIAHADSGLADAATTDATTTDTATTDALSTDTATTDTATTDAATTDTATTDTALPDTTTTDTATPVLYEQSFSGDTLAGYTAGSGSWSAADGVAKQTSTCQSTANLMLDGQDWTDVVVRVQVRFDDTCDYMGSNRQAALLVRVEGLGGCSSNRYYGCLIDADNDVLAAVEWNDECTTYDDYKSTQTSNMSTGHWYTLQATMVGNTLTCQVSGGGLAATYTVSRTDSSSVISSGSVGFATWEAAASFDDLVVERYEP